MESPVALVTGASRGIGREIALAFARDGFRVAINFYESQLKAEEVQQAMAQRQSLLIKADVAKSQEVHDMVSEVIKNWGRIDVLVNNAGIARDRTILKMSDSEWEDVQKVNLNGAFWCLRDCAKVMVELKEGAILNIASIAAVRGGSVGNANYAASKAGLIALTKSAAKELGRFNIRVNAILPGFHLTDMGMTVWKKYEERVRSEHTLGRLTDLSELAQFVLFLAKQKSVNGQVFNFENRVI